MKMANMNMINLFRFQNISTRQYSFPRPPASPLTAVFFKISIATNFFYIIIIFQNKQEPFLQ